ncbi:MAG: glycosyltransferase family 4 protein, partial [Actinomycetota bacterium]|nr:glycosyltransferase family 4 protein [Actinomycetota bacterium]
PLVARLEEVGVATEVLPMAEAARGLRRNRVRLAHFPAASALHTAVYVGRLTRRLRWLGPDLVHTNSLKSGIYGSIAARLAGVPAVWHLHDRVSDDYLPRPAVTLVRALVAHLPASVIANSRSTLATVDRPGVVAEVIAPPVPTPLDSCGLPGRDGSILRVGMVGRLAQWKGQHVFLEAFARAFPDGGAEAVIVGAAMFGDAPYEADLHAQVTCLGLDARVQFTGFLPDVGGVLRSLDVLVHASVVPEPFGQVVVEGMAAGLAVVASNVGGPAEVITDGSDGILVPPSDPDALAQALRGLASDRSRRRALGVAARKRALDFAPEVIGERVLLLYRHVLGVLPGDRS